MKFYISIVIYFLLILIIGCNKRINTTDSPTGNNASRIDIPVFGSDASLEILSWNVENFPLRGEKTVFNVAEIIKDLDADIVGFQEIADTVSFRELLKLLPNYDGVYSKDIYNNGTYQKTAVIYKKDFIQISQVTMLFTDDGNSFPRPPLQVYIRAVKEQKIFDFTLINLHLKAFGGTENENRRRSACQKLKNYLDIEILNSQDKDFMVIGDWNDELDDPINENVFKIFLDDSLDYHFLTYSLAINNPSNATYIGSYQSFLDHILISKDLRTEYASGITEILKIDQFYSPYTDEVSDHRPVGTIFPVF